MERRLAVSPEDPFLCGACREKQEELQALEDHWARGAFVRSCICQWATVLTLLPKKGDLCDLRNWRPVSLLSTDYKIEAKAISLQLGSMMADVIHPDQTYTVPGRSIFDNLFLVRDLLEFGHRDSLSFALLSLDQEKAFNRVDHGYLLGTLQAFGFGHQFVSFLQVLYASAECLVRLNWTLTQLVSFRQGVQQGYPLSGQLYALVIEPFLCLLHRSLTGLVLREPELRLVLSAYADDVILVVQAYLALAPKDQMLDGDCWSTVKFESELPSIANTSPT
ncbi:unnamed protein product [Caretta caretta]